jgi:hypothetical protein
MGGRPKLVGVVGSLAAALLLGGCPFTPPSGGGGGGGSGGSAASPAVGGCAVFPSDNAWNQRVDTLPLRSNSAALIDNIGATRSLHPDFGGNGEYGIPFVVVPSSEPGRTINFTAYGDESDPGPYPIPLNAPIEGASSSDGDRHVIALQQGSCRLYELYRGFRRSDRWDADAGANWDLSSNARRPLGWTSADPAALPILPGLVRYDEVAAGEIKHAIRFTVPRSQRGYIFPATHYASSSSDANLPPMGLRVRLKASYDIARLRGQALVIAQALKKYGMINADNGSAWFITGAADPSWDDDDLNQLKSIPGSAFEAVETGPVHT